MLNNSFELTLTYSRSQWPCDLRRVFGRSLAVIVGSNARAACPTRAVGVAWRADEGRRMRVQSFTSLSKNMCLCSYVLISFLQLESDGNGSIAQPSARFPILDRAIMQYRYSKMGNVFIRLIAGNTDRSPLCNALQPTKSTPL
jgi:hypothetical protein